MVSQFTYMRWRAGEPRESRVVRPLRAAVAAAAGLPCVVCGRKLGNGRPVQLLVLGPDDEDNRARCAAGGWFSALALIAHAECLGTPQAPNGDQHTASTTEGGDG